MSFKALLEMSPTSSSDQVPDGKKVFFIPKRTTMIIAKNENALTSLTKVNLFFRLSKSYACNGFFLDFSPPRGIIRSSSVFI